MKYLVYLMFCLLLISCKNVNKTDDFKPKNKNITLESISLKKSFNELFQLRTEIKLESVQSNLFGRPWQIITDGDNIFIIDLFINKRLFQFSTDGKYKRSIGKTGKGPGEYLNPSSITITKNNIILYDPSLMKVILYNKYDGKFESEWGVKKYYESVISIGDTIIFLNKYGHGYDSDLDLFYTNGNKISQCNFPKSSSESKRKYLFGGSFKIKNLNDNVLYIGADEYRVICYDTKKNNCLWVSNKFPSFIKSPKIPTNLTSRKRITWLKENYTSLYDVLTFDNGLIMIQAGQYFIFLDNSGNYLTSIKNKSKYDIYFTDGKLLYQMTDNDIKNSEKSFSSNPKVNVYSLTI